MWSAAADVEALLEPQERFDALCAVARRRFGRRVLDLAYPNPVAGPEDRVRQALRSAIDARDVGLQYTPFGGRTTTRRVIAAWLSREYGLPFAYRDVVLTPGAMAALNVAFRSLFGSDDEVIVLTPCWLDYLVYLRHLGVSPRLVAQRDDKHFDLTAIEQALTPRTRGVLFSQPCCPTGVVYSEAEIRELSQMLTDAEGRFDRSIYLISDEVHRHVVWNSRPFFSPLSSYQRSLSIYSFGKALSLQGQRIGYVAVSPRMPEREMLRRQLERATRLMGFCTPTALMQHVVCGLLDYRPPLDALAADQALMRYALKAGGYDVCDAGATVFVYVRAPVADDFAFAEALADHGVLVMPSTLFHERGYFRISVTASREALMAVGPVFERMAAPGHA